ncbi:MAG: hypothetical protein IJF74_04780 [Clostridia bacterium]|nr:hypothetical protein [Clostridia bacterium]
MKKITALLLTLFAILSLAACGAGDNAPNGMKLASNEVCDYYFYVPKNWNVDMSTGVSSAYFSEKDRSNMSMTSYALSKTMTAEEYWDSIKGSYTSLFAEMSEPEVKTTALDGVEAKQYTYTAKAGTEQYKIMQVFCVKGETVYVFTFTATPEKFEEHIDKVALVLAEFRFM